MLLEDRLTDALGRQCDEIAVPPGDMHIAVAQGRAQRRRHQAGTALLVAVLALAIAIPIRQWGSKQAVDPAIKPWGTWEAVTPGPLSPRTSTVGTWTGRETMFWGGYASPLTCGLSNCDSPDSLGRQGVAYDPRAHTWRRLADAPFLITTDWAYAQIGEHLVVENSQQQWWSYSPSTDHWERLRDAPEAMVSASTAVQGQLLYAVGNGIGDRVNTYDAVSGTWSSLPISQTSPRLADRHLIATNRGILAIGRVYGESSDGTPTFGAEFFNGQEWVRLAEDVPWAGACCWDWVGERLVIPPDIPSVATRLNELGVPTTAVPGTASVEFVADWRPFAITGPLMTRNGFVYDDRDGSWRRIVKPVGSPDLAGSSVWADGQLITMEAQEPQEPEDYVARPTSRVWVYTARE